MLKLLLNQTNISLSIMFHSPSYKGTLQYILLFLNIITKIYNKNNEILANISWIWVCFSRIDHHCEVNSNVPFSQN